MKKVVLALTLLALTSLPTFATTEIPMSCSSPKDDHSIGHPIGRSSVRVPSIGIEGTTLVRLQAATNLLYYIEVLQDNEVVYSSNWNFQDEELSLPSGLQGEYEIVLSDGSKSFVGTFVI